MPASWAEAIRDTAALLQRFSDEPLAAAAGRMALHQEAGQWYALVKALTEDWQPPRAAERAELQSLVRSLNLTIAAWDEPLQRLLQGPSEQMRRRSSRVAAALPLFVAAGTASVGAMMLALRLEAGAEAALDACRLVALVLGSGRLLAEAMRLSAATFRHTELLADSLGMVLGLHVSILRKSFMLADAAGVLGTLAQQLAPAQALVAWLRELAASLQSIPPHTDELMVGLLALLDAICRSLNFSQHGDLLQSDPALCSSLTALLLPMVAKRLPADRQPPGFHWATTSSMAGVMATVLRPALQQHLAGSDDAAVLCLLKSAAAVVAQVAPADEEPTAVMHARTDAAALLGIVAECAVQRQCRQQAASVLLADAVLHQLGSALQAARACCLAGSDDPDAVHDLFLCWASVLGSLAQCLPGAEFDLGILIGWGPAASGAAPIISQWCAAATEALCSLPLLAAALDSLQHSRGQTVDTAPAQELAVSVLALASNVAGMCRRHLAASLVASAMHSQHSPPEEVAYRPELFKAACWLVHWAASQPAAWHRLLPAEQPLLQLLPLLSDCLSVAVPSAGTAAVQARSPAAQGARAAFWAAMQAVAAAGPPQRWPLLLSQDASFCCALALAKTAEEGPATLAHSPALLSMVDILLDCMAEGDDPQRFCSHAAQVLLPAARAPRLTAQLLASGSLAAHVEGLPEEDPESWWRLVQYAVQAVGGMEQAASAALEGGRGSTAASVALEQAAPAVQRLKAALPAADSSPTAQLAALHRALPHASQVAPALQAHWQAQDAESERQKAAQLELAQAAATRTSCAHMACPNLAATGKRGKRCSGCSVARYCSRACSVADWKAGHKHACKPLAAAREAEHGDKQTAE